MRKVDATSGPLTKQIIVYAIPLILTTILLNLFFYILFFTFVYRRYVKKGICREI